MKRLIFTARLVHDFGWSVPRAWRIAGEHRTRASYFAPLRLDDVTLCQAIGACVAFWAIVLALIWCLD